MKHVLILSIFLLIGNLQVAISQQNIITQNNNTITQIPQESIFIHYNKSLLFSGENLYYSIYCIESSSNILSTISKVVYVELINEHKKSVFKHKLFIDNGRGFGKYFIPSSIKSGNYKLIAYTQWMLNNQVNVFVKNDIKIINPFKSNDIIIDDKLDSLYVAQKQRITNTEKVNAPLSIRLNSTEFLNREKVDIELVNNKNEKISGNFSVSVKWLDSLKKPEKPTSAGFIKLNKSNATKNSAIKFLPEVRGEIISGKVYDKGNSNVVENIAISLSIPGEKDIFKVSKTNSKGEFLFNNHLTYDGNKAYLQVLDGDDENIEIKLNNKGTFNSDNLNFDKFNLSKSEKDFILKHSFYNQINNAYDVVKQDDKNQDALFSPFYGFEGTTYILDDYKRFPTFKEVIIEIVDLVSIDRENGSTRFQVDRFNGDYAFDYEPLILIDGVVVFDQDKLAAYDANLIKSLTVIRGLRVYGLQMFNGIISIETFNGNYATKESIKVKESFKIQPPFTNIEEIQRSYDAQNKNKYKRVPDFRTQLYWNPVVTLKKSNETFSFWTSDVKGEFEISIEGFTNSGRPISLKEKFMVK
jgi:hypothetical protein